MNLKMIPPKNETENLLLSIIKNCETLIEPTNARPEETLEFKLAESRQNFQFNPPILIEEACMIGLISLSVNNSVFIIPEEINKFELYTDPVDSEYSFTEFKNKVAEVLGLSDFSIEDLEHEM